MLMGFSMCFWVFLSCLTGVRDHVVDLAWLEALGSDGDTTLPDGE